MWFAAPTGQSRVAGAFVTLPDYDTAMFWAQLSAIPMLAIFFVHVETGLKALSNRFFTGLERHAGLRQLRDITGEIAKLVFWSLVGLFIAQMAICALSILFSLVAVETLNWRAAQMGILRNALIGVACHTSATFCLSILLFFDLRRPALGLASVFLVLNAALTFVSIQIGFSAYGIGFFVAAAITFLIGLALIHRELSILPYHAFVTNNPSARRKSERGAATAHG